MPSRPAAERRASLAAHAVPEEEFVETKLGPFSGVLEYPGSDGAGRGTAMGGLLESTLACADSSEPFGAPGLAESRQGLR